MKNFIPINRKLFDHYLWTENRKYSKFECWLDLLQLVSFMNDNSQMINGSLCKWKRGQYPISISYLCKRWNWTEKPVRNYLKLLEKDKMIALKRSSKWTTLTICNYESYNKQGQAEVDTEGNQGAIKGQQLKKENKEKMLFATSWKADSMYILKIGETDWVKMVDMFCLSANMERPIQEVQSHFINWLKKQTYKKVEPIVKHWNENRDK